MRKMKCGGCGNDTTRVEAAGNNPFFTRLVLTCVKCGSQSIVRIERPRIEVEFAKGSSGCFCVGWGESPNGAVDAEDIG